jgi:hypothetical protein
MKISKHIQNTRLFISSMLLNCFRFYNNNKNNDYLIGRITKHLFLIMLRIEYNVNCCLENLERELLRIGGENRINNYSNFFLF